MKFTTQVHLRGEREHLLFENRVPTIEPDENTLTLMEPDTYVVDSEHFFRLDAVATILVIVAQD